MYQISRVQTVSGDPTSGTVLMEREHRVTKLLGWYPAGPLKDDAETTGNAERMERLRDHDLIKFVAKEGGVRLVRARDLTLLN